MRPNPSIETLQTMPGIDGPPWNIDSVMADALKLSMTFRISCQHEIISETRVVPSTVYLGHDMEYLYVGGKFQGMYRNPASNPPDDPNLGLPNYFDIFFDVANDGVLTFPESGSHLTVEIDKDANWRTRMISSYDDKLWSYSSEVPRSVWLRGEDYYWPNAPPAFASGTWDLWYHNSTGTLIILFSRFLRHPATSKINSLQMRSGERWVMGFLFELGYSTWFGEYANFVDGWPQKTYPYLSNDSSWWPKLVIDLTNQPPGFT